MFKYFLIFLIGALWGCANSNILLDLEHRCMRVMSHVKRQNHLKEIKTCTANLKEHLITPESRYLYICEENNNLCVDKIGSYYKKCLNEQEEYLYDSMAYSLKMSKATLCRKGKDVVIEHFRKQEALGCIKNDKALLQHNVLECIVNSHTESELDKLVVTKSSVCEELEEMKSCIKDKFWTICKSEEQLNWFEEITRPLIDWCNEL